MATKVFNKPVIITLIPLLLIMCTQEQEPEINKECTIDIDSIDFSFGIDYEDTEQYLLPGEESDLDEIYLEEITDAIGIPKMEMNSVLSVCHWINQNFTFDNAGGAMIGVNTVNELYEIKTFYGCHSMALIISSTLRKMGFPAIMIETVDVQWGYKYNAGTVQNFAGHVMSEIYVDDKWILLDNNCTYVEEYDFSDPYIPMMNQPSNGYFVFAKGIDIWDYTSRDESFTHDHLIFFAENIYCFEEMFNTLRYAWSQ